jgi:hypothetical protein
VTDELFHGAGVMHVGVGGEVFFPRSGAVVEQSEKFHDGKAAVLLLVGRLGEFLLIFPGVHELSGTSSDGFDDKSVPEILGPNPGIEHAEDLP